jgi:hypothetical protein
MDRITMGQRCRIVAQHPTRAESGNITSEPRFVDAASKTLDLDALSPCIDSGLTEPFMWSAVDVAGRPRVMNGRVDMGAHEFRYESSLKGLLAGAWDVTSGVLRTGAPSVRSPFASEGEPAAGVPTNAVDWGLDFGAGEPDERASGVGQCVLDAGRVHSRCGRWQQCLYRSQGEPLRRPPASQTTNRSCRPIRSSRTAL